MARGPRDGALRQQLEEIPQSLDSQPFGPADRALLGRRCEQVAPALQHRLPAWAA